MHLRISTKHRGDRTYRYAQLVESYRRERDGMPAVRVVANLGTLSDKQIANFRLALAASRNNQVVVLPRSPVQRPAAKTVLDNLVYLPVVVALEMWRQWQLSELLCELIPNNDKEISDSEVIAALVLQRCTAPGSKLSALRWFPRTALPEFLGIPAGQFTNTRVHRSLSVLDQVTKGLQERLPRRYVAREGKFTALFIDVTDTWFVGHGPDLAEKGKTKEGLYRQKIGIVLMCNQDGYPLRWEVVPGRQHDSKAMGSMIESLAKVSWLGEAPLVCDRAMGKTAQLKELLQAGFRFLTALLVDEYGSYTDRIPYTALSGIDAFAEDAVQQVTRTIEAAGLSRVLDDLYVLDLGVVERDDESGDSATYQPKVPLKQGDKPRQALERIRQIRADLDSGSVSTYQAAGRPYGWRKVRVATLMKLLELTDDLQEEIMAGRAAGLSIACILRIAALPDPEQQRATFDREQAAVQKRLQRIAAKIPRRNKKEMERRAQVEESEPVRVRAVVCFNPAQFVDQRHTADRILAELHAFVRDLNGSLASPRSRQDEKSIYAKVDRELRRRKLVSAFEIKIHAQPRGKSKRFTVELRRKPEAWAKLRRYDGFNVLVAHPDTLQEAAELAQLYRAKDRVEKDFHIIKSVVELRPVRHRTDAKVRAHVALCMLALLVERTLEHKLATSAVGTMSAQMAFEQLSSTHLNRLQAEGSTTPVYTVTRASQDQLALLGALGLEALIDDDAIADRITPR